MESKQIRIEFDTIQQADDFIEWFVGYGRKDAISQKKYDRWCNIFKNRKPLGDCGSYKKEAK